MEGIENSWLGVLDWTSDQVMLSSFSYSMGDLLLPGEDIIAQGQGGVLVNIDIGGTLLVTNFRLIFVSEGQRNVVQLGTIPLATIEKFTKMPTRASPAPRARDKIVTTGRFLQVVGKDMRVILYRFRPRTKQRRAVYDGLMRVARPTRLWELYASRCGPSLYSNSDPRDRLHAEYLRILGFSHNSNKALLSGSRSKIEGKHSDFGQCWRLTHANSNYNLCPTYPSVFITAASISDEDLQQAATFRARGRLPVMCWCHPENGAVLARSSQPLIGLMMNNRSNADEALVAALCVPVTITDQERRKLYIADARPRKNALANGAMGGGSESSVNYFQSEIVFLGIDNIHAMRESLTKLREYLDMYGAASSDGSSSLLRSGALAWGGGNVSSMVAAVSALGYSGWLMHVYSVLVGASWIAARIALEGASVLVHCSDGWDRTTQLVSLAGLMLDPYYRTFKGFQALVEKDWLAFGHCFADRLGMPTYSGSANVNADNSWQMPRNPGGLNPGGLTPPGITNPGPSFPPSTAHTPGAASNNYSPIFLQWVDCVAQLIRLYPRAFEFSSAFLVDMVDCFLSCRFGNFLCNSEKERLLAGVTEKCGCMWVYLEKERSEKGNGHGHYNIFYMKDAYVGALLPPAAALAPTLWQHFFLRWACPSEISTGHKQSTWVQCGELDDYCRSLAESNSRLKKERERADQKVREMSAKVKILNEQLRTEKQATAEANAGMSRVQKENTAIMNAMQTVGCKVKVSDACGSSSNSFEVGSDEEEEERSKLNGREGGTVINQGEVGVSVSITFDSDRAASIFRNTCGDTSCGLHMEEGCKWPRTGCTCISSAFSGLRMNFDALERLSVVDSYFGPGINHGSTLPDFDCEKHHSRIKRHQPGVT